MPSVPVSSCGHARGIPRGLSVGTVLLLKAEPTFLAHVANSTWHDANMEMHKFAHHARGPHALLHVKQLHSYDLVFRGSGEKARLVVPGVCR